MHSVTQKTDLLDGSFFQGEDKQSQVAIGVSGYRFPLLFHSNVFADFLSKFQILNVSQYSRHAGGGPSIVNTGTHLFFCKNERFSKRILVLVILFVLAIAFICLGLASLLDF